ncbi:hypothetical protein DdX_13413 [Ditylenchus destructor]|uniref:Uncharacterized protein n=1 Tax=Ditylenchus destructor TaxID=166010 RepID=A0AAD4MWQ9_9BILA|nr:hypothetical protein DdX_13413 [Ditylenchus destructor]
MNSSGNDIPGENIHLPSIMELLTPPPPPPAQNPIALELEDLSHEVFAENTHTGGFITSELFEASANVTEMHGIASNPIIVNNYVSQASANESNFASSSGTLVGSDQSKFANSCFPASATNTNTNKPPGSILNSGKRSLNPPTFFSPKGTAGAPPPLGPPNHYFASQLNKNGATLTRMYPRFDDFPLTMSLSPYVCDLNNGASQTDYACLIGIKLCDVFEVNDFTWKESFQQRKLQRAVEIQIR